MTTRRAILATLAAALVVASLALLTVSRSTNAGKAVLVEKQLVPDQPYRNPFPTAQEVRLFVEVDYRDGNPIYSNPKGRVLTASQRAEFESAMRVHTIAPDDEFTMCFIPHHFFRYFDKRGKQVGEVQVCCCCAGVQQSDGSSVHLAQGQMLVADYGRLESLVASLGERTDVQCEGEI